MAKQFYTFIGVLGAAAAAAWIVPAWIFTGIYTSGSWVRGQLVSR